MAELVKDFENEFMMSTLNELDSSASLSLSLPQVSIIAMKGHPFTRKTEFATCIASSLDCPLLSLEHILDVLQPSFFQTLSPHPQDLAFQIICGMAEYHLREGVSKNVVIDSALSSATHFHQLTKLASSFSDMRARVVIVECKPANVYLWQMKLEEHLARNPDWACKWYKPKNWEDVEKAIKVVDEYEESHILVSKLMVDPLLDQPIDDLLDKCSKFSKTSLMTPRFIEAVKYMITRDEGDSPDVVVFHQYCQNYQNLSSSNEKQDIYAETRKRLTRGLYCINHGHNMSNSTVVEGLGHQARCRACEKDVMMSDNGYNCKDCKLALHKECAEAFDNNNTWGSPFPESHLSPDYRFPKEYPCYYCMVKGKGFSNNCGSCLFETHLKCRLMPTIINYVDTEEHFLTIVLAPIVNIEVYRCVVCGGFDKFNLYLCKICGIAYHYKCLTLPRRVKHEHGGHHHHLSLKFSSEREEDYICSECLERRDPGLWFYSCEDCPYEIHLSCVPKKEEVE